MGTPTCKDQSTQRSLSMGSSAETQELNWGGVHHARADVSGSSRNSIQGLWSRDGDGKLNSELPQREACKSGASGKKGLVREGANARPGSALGAA